MINLNLYIYRRLNCLFVFMCRYKSWMIKLTYTDSRVAFAQKIDDSFDDYNIKQLLAYS